MQRHQGLGEAQVINQVRFRWADEPRVKHPPSYWIGSSTSAAFAEFLARNDGTLFSYSLEAGELVRIALGKFSKDNAGDFDLLLSGYTVEVFRETRVGRGDHELTPCVSVLWFCQPFLLRELFANEEALERGLTARVLPFVVEHDVIPYDDGIVRTVDEQANNDWDRLIRDALSLRDERHTIQCSDEAREYSAFFTTKPLTSGMGTIATSKVSLDVGAKTLFG